MKLSLFAQTLTAALILCAGPLYAQKGTSTSADAFSMMVIEPDPADLRSFIELARSDIKTQKAIILAQNMTFTESEAVDFWPVYREYDLELSKLYDRRFAMIKRFIGSAEHMSDADARKLADEALSLESDRTALKRKYFKKFTKVIPPAKAARFFQIENQVNTAIDLRIAAAMPLIK